MAVCMVVATEQTPWLNGIAAASSKITIDSNKLEHGCRMIHAGVFFFMWLAVGGRSCSNFLASTVWCQGNNVEHRDSLFLRNHQRRHVHICI